MLNQNQLIFILWGCSSYMLAIIWLIQLIHYPSFLHINENEFKDFHAKHTQIMGFLVGPIMVLELIISCMQLSTGVNASSISLLIIVLCLWFFTFFVSVPIHNKLSGGFQKTLIQKLILTNWLRTLLWTIKFLMMSFQLT